MSRIRSLLAAVLVAATALTTVSGCHRAAFDPARPATVSQVLRAYDVTVCAIDSTADNFVPTARENRERLADAAKELALAASGTNPAGWVFPGYYLTVDLPDGQVLRIDLHSRGIVSVNGTYYTGGEDLWDVAAGLLPVSAEEHDLLGPIYSATEAIVRVGTAEKTITDLATIAALARHIGIGSREGEVPADLGEIQAVITFTDGDSYAEVAVYCNYARVSVWYFRQEDVAAELLALAGM